jgi:hypothetical protein
MVEGLNLINFNPATLLGLEMKLSCSNGLTDQLAMISAGGTLLQARMTVAIQRPNTASQAVGKRSMERARAREGGGMITQGSIS